MVRIGLRTWLLVLGARARFLSQSSTAIGLTALIGVSAQRGLIWFLMYDWYADLVEIPFWHFFLLVSCDHRSKVGRAGRSRLLCIEPQQGNLLCFRSTR